MLKGLDAGGLVFYTNTLSRKGGDIRAHPEVALTFWWPQLESQERFEGPAVLISDAEAAAYFATRPRVSHLGAFASQQIAPLASRTELEDRDAALALPYARHTT